MKAKFLLCVGVMFLLLFLPKPTFAWTKAGNIYTTNGSYSDVNSAITDAAPGDIVGIPQGTFTAATDGWDVTLFINKKITLKGAGMDLTTINGTASPTIQLHSANAGGARITGITFVNQAVSRQIVVGDLISTATPVVDFRIDHNRLYATNYCIEVRYASLTVRPQGLIDNNEFHHCTNPVDGHGYSTYLGVTSWSSPTNLGGNDSVFLEDNIYYSLLSEIPNSVSQATDCNRGAGYTFRYNTVYGKYVEAHGISGTPTGLYDWRQCRKWETYRNNFSGGGIYTSPYVAGNLRGGTGVFFDNIVSGFSGYPRLIQVNVDRAGADIGSCDQCVGSSPCDGNEVGQSGYLCRDQIGAGPDAFTWTVFNTPPPQSKEPAYIWGNTYNLVYVYPASTIQIVSGRDFFYEGGTIGVTSGLYDNKPTPCTLNQGYWATDRGSWNKKYLNQQGQLYKCDAGGVWQLYYTPYTYPHPLRLEFYQNCSSLIGTCCQPSEMCTGTAQYASDCPTCCTSGSCQVSLCGNGQCDSGECNSCPGDCTLTQCHGNGQCDSGLMDGSENCQTDQADCLTGGQICCSGTACTGNCCSNSNCSSPQVCTNHVCSQPVTGGLVAAYSFNEGSGTTAQDSSGNGNTGTLVNSPAWTAGKYGNALSFDGVNDYVSVGSPASLTDLPNTALTISAWVYINSTGGNLFTKAVSSTSVGWQFGVDQWRRAALTIQRATTDLSVLTATNTLPPYSNGWFHIAVTYPGGDEADNVHIYVNGAEVSGYQTRIDGNGTYQTDNGMEARIGRNAYSIYTAANFDEVRIHNRSLTQAEIQADMNTPIGIPCIHKSDTNCDGCVKDPELLAFIGRWYINNLDVTMKELMEAVGLRNRGCSG